MSNVIMILRVCFGLACLPLAVTPSPAALYLSIGDTNGGYVSTSSFQGYVPGSVLKGSGTVDAGNYVYSVGRVARADYGTLGVGVAGFTHVIDNPYNALAGIFLRPEAAAQSTDRITVRGGVAGTPVTIYADVDIHVTSQPSQSAFYPADYPSLPTGVSAAGALPRGVQASLDIPGFGSAGYSSDGCAVNCIAVPDPAHPGDAFTHIRFTKSALVGDTVDFNPSFQAAAQVTYVYFIGGVLMGSAAFNGLGTAQFGISFSDPTVIAEAASGHVYTLSTAPEPATWALLITGFALTGVAIRRRAVTA